MKYYKSNHGANVNIFFNLQTINYRCIFSDVMCVIMCSLLLCQFN